MAVSDFPSGGSLSRGVLRQQNNQEVKLAEEQEQSLLQSAGRLTMGGLSAAANFLDLPGSMIRDVLALENPLDQVLSPFSDKNRTTGEDLLLTYGLMSKRPSRRTSQSVVRDNYFTAITNDRKWRNRKRNCTELLQEATFDIESQSAWFAVVGLGDVQLL